jgi:hypothetical protein
VAVFQLSPTAESVRAIPLHRIEAAVAGGGTIADELARRSREKVPALGTAAFLEKFAGYLQHEPAPKLERPAARLLPDSFYAQVADVYRAALARGLKPRTAIPMAASVSSDVAGRWVHEARLRGCVEPTDRGRVVARTKGK